ncbi:Nuclear pore complex protein Nup54 [Armadillidium nasatum]|uniref:Nuclear pore complex protein Nup54 n=1 Tax=Armadillidium nasatum TaxID=96803 RepID=A0A5N5SZM7_9CRUS|nr:Nuclear pore complex protein Nup54 [Armadillidium nasatum]
MTTGSGFSLTGFNQPTSSSSFGFGTNQSNLSGGLNFGSTLGQQSNNTLGFGAGNQSSGGLFGPKTTASTGFSLTGGGLFSVPKTTSNTFGFGSTSAFKGFGQPQQTQQPPFQNTLQQTQQQIDPLYLAVCVPTYFNDERDEVLKKWNQLQAIWGAGKGYYAQNMPPVEFTPDNPFCRFKAVGYVKLPTYSPEDGFVELTISKKESEVRAHQQQIVDTLVKLFDGCQVCVDYVRPFGETKTRMCIFVQQRNPNGETKKIQSWLVYNHLNSQNQNIKNELQNLFIENVTPLVSLSESQLKEYLEMPPRGIDPMIWEQGKRANPDEKTLLPVPMVGFQELQTRFKAQEEESRLLQGQLDSVAEEVTLLQGKQSKLLSDLQECKRRQILMSHRVLKGRLNEILSQISVQPGSCPGSLNGNTTDHPRYSLDSEVEKDLHQFLSWEQEAIKELVNILKKDLDIANKLLSQESK